MSLKCKNCGASITRIQEIGPGFGGKGWCVYCEGSMPSAKDARIAALESALAKAEEALEPLNEDEAFCVDPWCQADLDAGHPHKPECKWTAALDAIQKAKKGCTLTSELRLDAAAKSTTAEEGK